MSARGRDQRPHTNPTRPGRSSAGGDDLVEQVLRTASHDPDIARLRLAGSRAEGRANPFSDWDFVVETSDFPSAAVALPRAIQALSPLGTFWDPLSPHWCFIALMPGPRKVDFIFDEPHEPRPPYIAARDSLAAMDVYFWDWTVWLAAKEAGHKHDLVSHELQNMHGYLLEPLGVDAAPSTISQAVRTYLTARTNAEKRFGTRTNPRLTRECLRFLAQAGYEVQTRQSPS